MQRKPSNTDIKLNITYTIKGPSRPTTTNFCLHVANNTKQMNEKLEQKMKTSN